MSSLAEQFDQIRVAARELMELVCTNSRSTEPSSWESTTEEVVAVHDITNAGLAPTGATPDGSLDIAMEEVGPHVASPPTVAIEEALEVALPATSSSSTMLPSTCSTGCPSRDVSASAPSSSISTNDVVPELAAPVVSDEALIVEATVVTASTPTRCSTGGLYHNTARGNSMALCPLPRSVPTLFTMPQGASPPQSLRLFVALELDIKAPTRCSIICLDDRDMSAFRPVGTSNVEYEKPVLRPSPWPSFIGDQAAHCPIPYHGESANTDETEYTWKPIFSPQRSLKITVVLPRLQLIRLLQRTNEVYLWVEMASYTCVEGQTIIFCMEHSSAWGQVLLISLKRWPSEKLQLLIHKVVHPETMRLVHITIGTMEWILVEVLCGIVPHGKPPDNYYKCTIIQRDMRDHEPLMIVENWWLHIQGLLLADPFFEDPFWPEQHIIEACLASLDHMFIVAIVFAWLYTHNSYAELLEVSHKECMARKLYMGIVRADFQGRLILTKGIWVWSLHLPESAKKIKQEATCNMVCRQLRQLGLFVVHVKNGVSRCSCHYTAAGDTWYGCEELELVNLQDYMVKLVELRSWNCKLATMAVKPRPSWESYSLENLSSLLHSATNDSENAQVQGILMLMDTSVHWQFLRKEEFEGSGNYSSACRTMPQSAKGILEYELTCSNQVSRFRPVVLVGLQWSAYCLFSGTGRLGQLDIAGPCYMVRGQWQLLHIDLGELTGIPSISCMLQVLLGSTANSRSCASFPCNKYIVVVQLLAHPIGELVCSVHKRRMQPNATESNEFKCNIWLCFGNPLVETNLIGNKSLLFSIKPGRDWRLLQPAHPLPILAMSCHQLPCDMKSVIAHVKIVEISLKLALGSLVRLQSVGSREFLQYELLQPWPLPHQEKVRSMLFQQGEMYRQSIHPAARRMIRIYLQLQMFTSCGELVTGHELAWFTCIVEARETFGLDSDAFVLLLMGSQLNYTCTRHQWKVAWLSSHTILFCTPGRIFPWGSHQCQWRWRVLSECSAAVMVECSADAYKSRKPCSEAMKFTRTSTAAASVQSCGTVTLRIAAILYGILQVERQIAWSLQLGASAFVEDELPWNLTVHILHLGNCCVAYYLVMTENFYSSWRSLLLPWNPGGRTRY